MYGVNATCGIYIPLSVETFQKITEKMKVQSTEKMKMKDWDMKKETVFTGKKGDGSLYWKKQGSASFRRVVNFSTQLVFCTATIL